MIFTGILIYPVVEIIAFFLVAKATSWATVFSLTLGTSFLGVALFRRRRFGVGASDFTARSLENYLFGNLGAFALIMPGFVSDLFGIILLSPPLRRALLAFVRFCGFDSRKNSVGNFSFLRAFSFSDRDNNAFDPNRYDSDEEPIDVESCDPRERSNQTRSSDDSSSDDSDAIEVDYVVRQ